MEELKSLTRKEIKKKQQEKTNKETGKLSLNTQARNQNIS